MRDCVAFQSTLSLANGFEKNEKFKINDCKGLHFPPNLIVFCYLKNQLIL